MTKQMLLVGAIAAICAGQAALGQGPPSSSNAPFADSSPTLRWLELRDGVRAYTGDDGGGADTLTVCPSAELYKRWSSDTTANVPECKEKARGIPITIASNRIEALDPRNLPGDYVVFIRADDSTWAGWTGSIIGIKPRIPLHTKVVFVPAVKGGRKMLFPNRTSPVGAISFETETVLEILGQDQTSHGPDLYGQVVRGSVGVGSKGWFHSLGLNVLSDGPLLFRPKT
jgi:hypothetical protein